MVCIDTLYSQFLFFPFSNQFPANNYNQQNLWPLHALDRSVPAPQQDNTTLRIDITIRQTRIKDEIWEAGASDPSDMRPQRANLASYLPSLVALAFIVTLFLSQLIVLFFFSITTNTYIWHFPTHRPYFIIMCSHSHMILDSLSKNNDISVNKPM